MNRKDTVLVVKEIPPDRDPAARRAAVQEAIDACPVQAISAED